MTVRAATRQDYLDRIRRVIRFVQERAGELVRAYNMTVAVNGALRIEHPTAWVREILGRVGLLDLLSADLEREINAASGEPEPAPESKPALPARFTRKPSGWK